MRIRVEASPKGRGWVLTAPAFPGASAFSRSFTEIDSAALQLAVTAADMAPTKIDLDLHIGVEGLDVLAAQRQVAEAKAAAEAAAERASAVTREVARTLRAAGVTLSDIGQVLGLTHQRVSQLVR